jgi:hypothetical protein
VTAGPNRCRSRGSNLVREQGRPARTSAAAAAGWPGS